MSTSVKPASVFDDKKTSADSYIIQGSNRSRHKFRHLPASAKWHTFTDEYLAAKFPKVVNPSKNHAYDEEMYDQATIGQCDDEGYVKTGNKEHAKLILKEYRTLDPKCRLHTLSLPLDEREPVDMKKAAWHPSEEKEVDNRAKAGK